MIKTKNTFCSVLSKHLIVLGFFLLLVAKPIVNTVFDPSRNTYEWFSFFDKEVSVDKEISADFNDENIDCNYFTQVSFYSENSKLNLYINKESKIQNNIIDIFLPPPKQL